MMLSGAISNKARRFDGLPGRVMDVCADQLGLFFTRIFQCILDNHSVLHSWILFAIMPIAK